MVEVLEIVKFRSLVDLFESSVPVIHEKKVRVFYHNLTLSDNAMYLMSHVYDVNIILDEQVLVEALRVDTQGTRSLKDKCGFEKFLRHIGKLEDLNIKSVTKNSLKEEYQILFELVNKALILCTEKYIIVTAPTCS